MSQVSPPRAAARASAPVAVASAPVRKIIDS